MNTTLTYQNLAKCSPNGGVPHRGFQVINSPSHTVEWAGSRWAVVQDLATTNARMGDVLPYSGMLMRRSAAQGIQVSHRARTNVSSGWFRSMSILGGGQ